MQPERPNILWLMTDEQRADSMGCYGRSWAHTPNLDRLASQGAIFDNAITPAPVCTPARTSILTGRYPAQTDVWHNSLDLMRPLDNLMPLFREAGYQTASFGKHHYVGDGAFETEGGGVLTEQVHYYHYDAQYDEADYDVVKYPGDIYNWIFGGRFPEVAAQRTEAQAVDLGLDWLAQRDTDQPFFLRVSFNGPHTPVVPPPGFDQLVRPEQVQLPPASETAPDDQPRWLTDALYKTSTADRLTATDIQKMRGYYYSEVAFLDHQFGRLLDEMDERGLLENTIVVYVSDHGTHLGDYGLVQKQTFYEPVVNVPFFCWYPAQIAAGVRLSTPVGIHSLLPTLLELADIGSPPAGCATSLAEALRAGQEPEREPIFSALTLETFAPHVEHQGRLVMVRDGDWKLSVCLDPDVHDEALYNVGEDPFERHNLVGDNGYQGRQQALLDLIHEHINTTGRLDD